MGDNQFILRRDSALGAALVIFAVLLFVTCKSLPKPQEPVISIQSAEFTEVNYNGLKFLCKVQIENPNDIDIPFPQIHWRFFINTGSFVSGIFKEDKTIEAHETITAEIPVDLNYLEIFNMFSEVKGTAQADYKLEMDVKFPPLKGIAWHLETDGVMPVLQAPKFGRSIMRIEKRHSNMVEWYVSVNVENPNAFELPVPKHTFVYSINETPFIRRAIQHRQALAPSATSPLVFGLLVYYSDVSRVFPDLMVSLELPSQLDMKFDFSIPAFTEDLFQLILSSALPLP